ncbi:MAG: hypothetical protein ABS81_01065 [Pseudonocardia sp. SCN 72-86]|nr:MAG: hypothetical protein ABS81_01065 [Pseudonocardia sp. SCN 72-86]
MRYLITGAGSGIGRAVATLAARRAAGSDEVSLALVDHNAEALEVVADDLAATGARCLPIALDLSDVESPNKAVVAAVADFGGLDAVVSNAGTTAPGPLELLSVEDYERTFAINTRVTWLLGKAAYGVLSESRGSITATASISAQHPTPPLGAYSPSKAALVMLVRQMALEWGRSGIRCNCVSPGPTDTGLTAAAFGGDGGSAAATNRAHRVGVIPLQKIGRAEDVAEAVLFLAGPGAAQITGVDLAVDGGTTLAIMPLAGGVPGYGLPEIAGSI